MLNPSRKITAKEIEESTYTKATSFYYEYKQKISYAAVAVLILIAGTIVFMKNRNANNESATVELGKVFSIYDAGATDPNQYRIAIEGQPGRNVAGLRSIVERFGGSETGEVARLYLANAYLFTGNYDEALKQYGSFSGSADLLKASAQAGMGAAYEAKKEYAKAAAQYEKAASMAGGSGSVPEYLNAAARCFGVAGDKEKAISLLKRLKKEFPGSSYAREVDRYISQFSA